MSPKSLIRRVKKIANLSKAISKMSTKADELDARPETRREIRYIQHFDDELGESVDSYIAEDEAEVIEPFHSDAATLPALEEDDDEGLPTEDPTMTIFRPTATNPLPTGRLFQYRGNIGLCGQPTKEKFSAAEIYAMPDAMAPMIHTWTGIPNCITYLYLDMSSIWVPGEDDLPRKNLAPLGSLLNLKTLKVVCMMDSYQKDIFKAAWVLPKLEELTMEMDLEPTIRSVINAEWPTIQGEWRMMKREKPTHEYYGDAGKGHLGYHIGYGEYLDAMCIGIARRQAIGKGDVNFAKVNRLLTITKLNLRGFVVDAEAFDWFDPKKLKEINFLDYCIDAGFVLRTPELQEKVRVTWPASDFGNPLLGDYCHGKNARLVDIKGKETKDYCHGNNARLVDTKGKETKMTARGRLEGYKH